MKFKVGDKVKIIKAGRSHLSRIHFGKTAIIDEVYGGSMENVSSLNIGQGGVWNDEIELVHEDEIIFE